MTTPLSPARATLATTLPYLLAISLLLTGAAGLMYQVVWFRTLGLTFGVTVQATSAVLAAFMAGLAFGSFGASRVVGKLANPLRVYGFAELLIGVSGFASLWAFDLLQPVYQALATALPDQIAILTPVRFVLALLIMLLPTTLMGATLPIVVSAPLLRDRAHHGNISVLYAGNTAGAIAGAFLAGFYFIGSYGLTITTAIAAALNLTVGVIWVLAARADGRPTGDAAPADAASDQPPLTPRLRTVMLLSYGVSGAIALALEVVWTRVLSGIFPGTVYAFSMMLCAILTGIAAGSWASAPLLKRRYVLQVFIMLEIALGLAAILSIATLSQAFRVETFLRGTLRLGSELLIYKPWFMMLYGLLAIGPSAFLMGVLFPVAAKVYGAGDGDVGKRVGQIYGANTVGAITGSLAGGLLLIPLFGAQTTLWLLAAGNIAAGLAVLLVTPAGIPAAGSLAVSGRVRTALGVIGLAGALIAPRLLPDLYQQIYATIPWGDTTVWYQEGQDATVRVADNAKEGVRVLYINSEHQGADGGSGLDFHYRLGHLGPLLHPNPKEILLVGLGVGATPGAAAMHPASTVTVIELFPGVIDAARFFRHINFDIHNRPNVILQVNDGRNHLLLAGKKYDVIQADPIRPTNAGAGNLYSADYYRLAKGALQDDGLMVQWIDSGLPGAQYRMMLRTFLDVYPDATLWHDGQILVGSKRPLTINRDAMQAKFLVAETRDALALIGIRSVDDVLKEFTAGPPQLQAYAGDGPMVTDRNPRIEYFWTLPNDGTTADGVRALGSPPPAVTSGR